MPNSYPLEILPFPLAIARLPHTAGMPEWAFQGEFHALIHSPAGLTVVCASEAVPEEVECERAWQAIRVVGQLEFSLVGVIASLALPLAEAGVSIFPLATYETDFLLVKQADLKTAVAALVKAGHIIVDAMAEESQALIGPPASEHISH